MSCVEPDRRPQSPGDASPWVKRFAPLVRAGGTVVDVAAGGGRHTRLFAASGRSVVAVDRDTSMLSDLVVERDLTLAPVEDGEEPGDIEVVQADLEGAPWPFPGRLFDGVVVTNYLHRPLLPTLVASLAPGGVLIYETFALGQDQPGRPSNPDWLLRPGELLEAVRGHLHVVASEDTSPYRQAHQRIAAMRDG